MIVRTECIYSYTRDGECSLGDRYTMRKFRGDFRCLFKYDLIIS